MSRMAFEEEADFVIVGTGAGGATAARVLTEAGHDVLLLEEGPRLQTDERPERILDALHQAVRGFAGTATVGATPMPLLQGRCVGGSTAVNSGIIWRMPQDVQEDWTASHGLGELVEPRAQERIFQQLEDELEVAETRPEVRGGNGHLMERACTALGLPGKPIVRNAKRCRGAARCLQGCPGEARQSMDVSYIPRALAAGARLHADARVQRVRIARGRAVGVEGDVVDRETRKPRGRFRVAARRGVIVAAGAIHTPVILRRSGLKGLVGERFQAHPGAAVVGRFPEKVTMAQGATQSYEVPMRHQRFKIEGLSLPPEALAARIPGAGAEWQERLTDLDCFAQWCVQARMRAHGRVRPGRDEPSVRYEPLAEDLAVIQRAIGLICRMMFAAGATEVYPGLGRVPEILTDVSQVDALERAPLRRGDFHLVASHLFGTACAGSDPSRSVVGPDLQSHEVPGLYVMDASVFPTNMGVNPQHSIMAVVWRAAEWLAEGKRVQVAA
ncbi:MAG: GMC family oxidoreductase N-terminal domain-containing protein [Myxococcota bacterium]